MKVLAIVHNSVSNVGQFIRRRRMSFYKGAVSDRYCALCGARVRKVRCFSGTYDTYTGGAYVDRFSVCTNVGCVGFPGETLNEVEGHPHEK